MKKIKRYIICLIMCLMMGITAVNAKELEVISIKQANENDSSSVEIKDNDDKFFDVLFKDVDAEVKYEIEIKNESDKEIQIDEINITEPKNEAFMYSYEGIDKNTVIKESDTKTFYLNIKYTNTEEIEKIYDEDVVLKIGYSNVEEVVNPKTGIKTLGYIGIISVILVIGYLIIRHKLTMFKQFGVFVLIISSISLIGISLASRSGELEIDGVVRHRGYYDVDADSYGVKRALDSSSSSWERISASVGLEANAQIGETPVNNDFDNIYPWSDIKSYNYDTETKNITAWYGESNFTFTPDDNIEVLTLIPEFYYKREQKDGYEYIYIAREAKEGYSKSDEFSIGRYTMSGDSSRVHSRSGADPLRDTTITDFRTYARNLGDGFGQLDYHYFILQLLYLVEYADYDSQAVLGQGNSNSFRAVLSGGCDTLGMKSGSVINDTKHSVIYRGIEDIFGNIDQFVDGINIKDGQTYINYNPATYEANKFDGDYKAVGYVNAQRSNYITKLGYDPANPLVAIPTEVSGATNMFDYFATSSINGNYIAFVGGRHHLAYDGLWYWTTSHNSYSYSIYIGARLLKTS